MRSLENGWNSVGYWNREYKQVSEPQFKSAIELGYSGYFCLEPILRWSGAHLETVNLIHSYHKQVVRRMRMGVLPSPVKSTNYTSDP
jgi:endo-alpha-1,4-polygalactosaminidase (GH114 family)